MKFFSPGKRAGIQVHGLYKQTIRILLGLWIPVVSWSQAVPVYFEGDREFKTATLPSYVPAERPSAPATVTIHVDVATPRTPVPRYLYGNNANVYMTQMVDQPVLLDYITKLAPQVIRFPGGNLSSVYFWNAEKNSPPADAPEKLVEANGAEINPGYWYGKNAESWTLSVDNYYEMLKQTRSTGIITVNYGYARYGLSEDPVAAAAHLAAQWVRYDNGRTKFWEVGNESNGTWQAGFRIKPETNKDGQPEIVTGSLYGKHFRVFADSMRKAAAEIGSTIYIGAQLLAEEPASWWNATDRNWNAGVFAESGDLPDFYIVHSYYTPYQTNSKASDILNSATTVTGDMMEYLDRIQQQAGVTRKPIALTEWNIFAEGSKQQVSYINGMHAALVLGELIRNKYALACRWNLANAWEKGNDHGMFSQGDEPGVPRWHPRASYHYLYYFRTLFGDELVESSVSGSNNILAYASTFSSGEAGIVLVNKGTTGQVVRIDLSNFGYGERYYWYTLTGGTDNGEFSLKVFVNGVTTSLPSGGPTVGSVPARSTTIGEGVVISAPPRSVTYLVIEHGEHVITSVSDDTLKAFHIYPNPAAGVFTVQVSAGEFFRLEIYDARGNYVTGKDLTPGDREVVFDTLLRKGLYVIQARSQGKLVSKKVIIH